MSASFSVNVVLYGDGYKDIVVRVKSCAPRGSALGERWRSGTGFCGSGTGNGHSSPVGGRVKSFAPRGFATVERGIQGRVGSAGTNGGAAMAEKASEQVGLEQVVKLSGAA